LPATADLPLSGRTRGGMEFSGRLAGATADALQILPPDSPESSLLGIPTDAIESLTILFPDPPSPRFEDHIERLLPLLYLWDRPSREALLAWMDSLPAAGDWPRLHLWTTALAGSATEDALRQRAALLKARSLHELGLFIQLDEELEPLNKAVPPLEAPALLCWLNAHRARARGDTEQARFWARLPALRIPVASGSVAEQLQAFLPSLEALPAASSTQTAAVIPAP
ncbi:MAG TPA: hypothetical protein VJ960_05430, partial [Oceanipulchritudo sp.]|nr:hypothetical protein [Oceanipulchritudo sp.]